MSQGSSSNSRIGMTHTKQKFDDSHWEGSFRKGSKKKTEKQNQNKTARRIGNRQLRDDGF